MYELHAPMMLLLTKKFHSGMLNEQELKVKLEEVVGYLKEAYYILSFEPENSQEHLMAQAAKEALCQTKEWEKTIGKF